MHFKSLTPCGWFFLRGSSVFKARECVCVERGSVCAHLVRQCQTAVPRTVTV